MTKTSDAAWMRLHRAREAYIRAKEECDRTLDYEDGVAAARAYQTFAEALRGCGIEPEDRHANHPSMIPASEWVGIALAKARQRRRQ